MNLSNRDRLQILSLPKLLRRQHYLWMLRQLWLTEIRIRVRRRGKVMCYRIIQTDEKIANCDPYPKLIANGRR